MENNLNRIEIGERIRSLRENMFFTRERFAEMIDISEVFLGQIERGECSLSVKTLSSIVNFTGSSTDFILFGDTSQNSNIKKIERMLSRCSDETIQLVYNIVNEINRYNKKQNTN